MPEAVIVSAVRTPIGRAGKGALKVVRGDDLARRRRAWRGLARSQRRPTLLEDVIIGCAFPEGEQGMNLARIVTALAGLPVDAGGTTVNRFCASSLQAFNMAAQSIMLGQGDLFIAGGVESMSRVPMGGFNPSFNPKLINNPSGIEICGLPGKLTHRLRPVLHPDGHDGGEPGASSTTSAARSRTPSRCAATSARLPRDG